MKSTSIKLILILLFLFVSVFFLFKISELYRAKSFFTPSEISETVKVLSRKSVFIDEDTVPKEKTVPKVIKLAFDASDSSEVAKRVMKSDYGTFTVPNGYSYTSDTETLSFFDDYTIEYSYIPSGITLEKVTSSLTDAKNDDGEKAEKTLTKLFFSDMDSGPYEVTMKVVRSVTLDGTVYLEAVECVDGLEIEGARVFSAIMGSRLLFVSGTLFFAEEYSDYKTDAFDGINILFEIEGKNEKIEKMELVYIPVFDEKLSVYLTPSYSFVYSDGVKKIYDATSASKRN